MLDTPRANRLHIAFFGKRNAGKSSLVNTLTNQSISLVSNTPGTTTDPVFKSMELLPLGPVVIVDTAGLDDEGALGNLRIKKTKEVMDRTDLAVLVISPTMGESNNISSINDLDIDLKREVEWIKDLKERNIPIIGVINKSDLLNKVNIINSKEIQNLNIPIIEVSCKNKENLSLLKEYIVNYAPSDFERPTIVGDIINKKAKVILVAPQDIQAPKGRLILPQVQVIRDLLDNDAMALTVKDTELELLLSTLNEKPDLIITDSQIFKKINKIVPDDIPLTSFSILMARYKGDLSAFVKGARAIDKLKPNDKVLIAEACTHHALKGDIAREKIPLWLKEKVGNSLIIDNISGIDFPDNLKEYKLIIQCGSCMFTRKQLMSRLIKAEASNVSITNFGVAIAKLNGILERTVKMFPEAKK
ncbi:[FeFe] hydrogenase H-cluster maturation GTPase HydF [Clostridium fallax]|uniref:[FeFe] hydrogenase H-cluster maturation GTPase HydF n=1 Tax=Clostridium fallax TaxID=1533 RepID=A0A1M4ZEX7_9CLOT|nr:[FeFe] hydrogenase H-cluster maturation GTPase HydF [Clostridium fallax]SHF16156.1 [FeFe] hydrogenase H-cluster maturation GTPase HydF [Clostridium fallax]SQB22215.1 GTP-binding protein [Clostridium fallax]